VFQLKSGAFSFYDCKSILATLAALAKILFKKAIKMAETKA
jgi:hypothetical protein